VRLATLEKDYWTLRSGEASHRAAPETFWIPSAEERCNLQRGQGARLIFDIQSIDGNGTIEVNGERMWVIVRGRIDDIYFGVLDSDPATIESTEETYLVCGAEVPFLAEHVIDIDTPPREYAEAKLLRTPTRSWSQRAP
jgi:hypothetical protein